jgi:hypothetical protein
MRNLTVSLDQEVARWARVAAAERDMSVSRFVGELLRERMADEQAYETALKSNLARKPRRLNKPGSYPSRETLHDRPVLRRH